MKTLIAVFIIFIVSTGYSQNLGALKYQKRIILVFEAKDNSTFFNEQVSVALKNKAAFDERDLVVIKAQEKSLFTRFKVNDTKSTVLLIGKDGTPKLRGHEIMNVTELCAIIDAMPMRKDEMKR